MLIPRRVNASQEEQDGDLVRPKYFIPVHGEYRQLFRHAALARHVGTVSGEILLLENGRSIEFTEDGAFRREPAAAGRVCVDSGSLEEIEEGRLSATGSTWRKTGSWCRSSPSTSTPDGWNPGRRW